MERIGTLHNAVTAADYVIAAVGRDAARTVMLALRAGYLTPAEAASVETLAAGIAYLLETDVPDHRGMPALIEVVRS